MNLREEMSKPENMDGARKATADAEFRQLFIDWINGKKVSEEEKDKIYDLLQEVADKGLFNRTPFPAVFWECWDIYKFRHRKVNGTIRGEKCIFEKKHRRDLPREMLLTFNEVEKIFDTNTAREAAGVDGSKAGSNKCTDEEAEELCLLFVEKVIQTGKVGVVEAEKRNNQLQAFGRLLAEKRGDLNLTYVTLIYFRKLLEDGGIFRMDSFLSVHRLFFRSSQLEEKEISMFRQFGLEVVKAADPPASFDENQQFASLTSYICNADEAEYYGKLLQEEHRKDKVGWEKTAKTFLDPYVQAVRSVFSKKKLKVQAYSRGVAQSETDAANRISARMQIKEIFAECESRFKELGHGLVSPRMLYSTNGILILAIDNLFAEFIVQRYANAANIYLGPVSYGAFSANDSIWASSENSQVNVTLPYFPEKHKSVVGSTVAGQIVGGNIGGMIGAASAAGYNAAADERNSNHTNAQLHINTKKSTVHVFYDHLFEERAYEFDTAAALKDEPNIADNFMRELQNWGSVKSCFSGMMKQMYVEQCSEFSYEGYRQFAIDYLLGKTNGQFGNNMFTAGDYEMEKTDRSQRVKDLYSQKDSLLSAMDSQKGIFKRGRRHELEEELAGVERKIDGLI